MASQDGSGQMPVGQPQMKRDGQSQGMMEETGTHVKSMAQGAADVGKGAVQGVMSIARGTAMGAANVAEGTADVVKNTFGNTTPDNNTITNTSAAAPTAPVDPIAHPANATQI